MAENRGRDLMRAHDRAEDAQRKLRDLDSEYAPLMRNRPSLRGEWTAKRQPLLDVIADRDRLVAAQ